MVYVIIDSSGAPVAASCSLAALVADAGIKYGSVKMQFKRRGFYKSAICSIFAVKLVQDGRKGNKNGKLSSLHVNVDGVAQHNAQSKGKSGAKHWIEEDF